MNQSTAAKPKNTVIESRIDVSRDIRDINDGKAKKGNDSGVVTWTVNSRTYGAHSNGFLTSVDLYINAERVPMATDSHYFDMARSVARDLDDEVLVSPPAEDPVYAQASYTWYLITPEGKRFIASEIVAEEGNNIVINRATLRPVQEP